ncbi:Nac domain-containing protein [Thalictrum thalictroides]|uniref:Nac domain-containing protein n=1 Tax=Thalictrum thalictroides TaxID=46969 RepID=A0A7J6V6M2_THATH|nr:Nac domain-containing protein [Thalictrum thalictroides]
MRHDISLRSIHHTPCKAQPSLSIGYRAWLIDSRGIAGKVKNATQLTAYQIKDYGASRECPSCHHYIDNSDVSVEWPGLPAGVKFDPSDVELLEHLAVKVGIGGARPHLFIDEFIPTLEGGEGICYTHPENLPGAKKDGSSVHFFHKTTKAYATGRRKRRKIHDECSSIEEQVRWHKTGKTKAVVENGIQKGWKKIMVLYKSSKKGLKPNKINWVMHQYHLGITEDETDSEFVVSKIFYNQQSKHTSIIEEAVPVVNRAGPTTPNVYTPNPPRRGKRDLVGEMDEEYLHNSKFTILNQIDEEHSQKSVMQVSSENLSGYCLRVNALLFESVKMPTSSSWTAQSQLIGCRFGLCFRLKIIHVNANNTRLLNVNSMLAHHLGLLQHLQSFTMTT